MKLSDLLEAKLPKWEVQLEVGPHQFITLSVNATTEEDAMKKAVAMAIKQSHRNPTPSTATKITEAKLKKETASQAFERYAKLKKSNAPKELTDKVLALANSLMTDEVKAKMRTLDSQYGGEDWWETVKTFYKIEERNGEFRVVSDAKDWKQEKQWTYPTRYEADEQLMNLIKYKINDRKAGKGSEDKDFERAELLRNRRTQGQ